MSMCKNKREEMEERNENVAENNETNNNEEDNEKNVNDNRERDNTGTVVLENKDKKKKIELLSIIGEIEGHDLINNQKTTKYDHVLPKLAQFEEDCRLEGLLILLQTCGGDVESGLAIAEMIASLSKPTVALVLGGSHSIGVPIAASASYSFIVPTGTMVVHPVRMNGLFIGAPQTYDYFKLIQDRITGFVTSHSSITKERYEKLMYNTGILTKDLGSVLVGEQAVREGIINQVGGIKEAIEKLYEMIDNLC